MISWTGMYDNTTDRIFLDRSSDYKEWTAISDWYPEGPELVGGDYYDRYLQTGMHYYRLRIEYLDGSVDLSDIVNVRICHEKEDISIWPNPTSGMVEVFVATELAFDELEYVLLDPQGRIWHAEKGASFGQLDLSTIPSGIYFLHVPALGLVRRITRT
jgi:hypothetical protein